MKRSEAIESLLKEKFNVKEFRENCELCGGSGKMVSDDVLDYCPKCHGRGEIKSIEYTKKNNNFNEFYNNKLKEINDSIQQATDLINYLKDNYPDFYKQQENVEWSKAIINLIEKLENKKQRLKQGRG